MKIILIGNYAPSLISFRGSLLASFVNRGHEVIACAPGKNQDVIDKLKSMGVEYYPLKFDRTGVNPLRDLIFLTQLVYLFRKVKPDVVFNYTIKPVIYGALAARLAGIAGVYSMITGLGYVFMGNGIRQRLLKMFVCSMYRLTIRFTNRLFFLNADDLALFEKMYLIDFSRKAILLNGEGIDLDYFHDEHQHIDCSGQKAVVLSGSGIDLHKFKVKPFLTCYPTFLLIARLIRDKGIVEYVEAAKILKNKHPNAIFQILGPFDSNPTAIKAEEMKKWQQEGVIEYLGETDDVRPFIANVNVYVLPSYREGLPRTIVEAMAKGRPIVTTDAPGCRETVIEGENGFIVPVRDAQALARAMEKFIMNPELIVTMGKRSREIAEEKFDVHKINAVIMKAMGFADEEMF